MKIIPKIFPVYGILDHNEWCRMKNICDHPGLQCDVTSQIFEYKIIISLVILYNHLSLSCWLLRPLWITPCCIVNGYYIPDDGTNSKRC